MSGESVSGESVSGQSVSGELTSVTVPASISHIVCGEEEQRVGRVHLQVLIRIVLGPVIPMHTENTIYSLCA